MRGTLARLQGSEAWRALGAPLRRRCRVVRADADRRARWRHVYPELRSDPERLRHAWVAVLGPWGLGGVLLTPFELGLFASALRVRPFARGFGIGTDLARFAGDLGAARGLQVWLVVAEGNRPALAAWRRAGFRERSGPTPVDRPGHVVFVGGATGR